MIAGTKWIFVWEFFWRFRCFPVFPEKAIHLAVMISEDFEEIPTSDRSVRASKY